jgi:hypothetical protein
MALPAWITTLFDPAVKLIDELHTSAEEKAMMKATLFTAQAGLVSNVLDYEAKIAEAKRDVIMAEAQGESWIQRSWRPIIMLTFGAIVAWNFILAPIGTWFALMFDGPALPQLEMTAGFWTLLSTGIGGYIVSRGGEKIVKTLNQ